MDVDPPSDVFELAASTSDACATSPKVAASPVFERVRRVLRELDRQKLSVSLFMHALFYGNKSCASDFSMAQRRRRFMENPLLPTIMQNLCKPQHRSAKHHGKRLRGAKGIMRNFAFSTVDECLHAELKRYEASLPTDNQPVTGPALLDISMDGIVSEISGFAPHLIQLLTSLMVRKGPSRRQRDSYELHRRNMIAVVGSMFVFARSNRQNKLQRKLSIYFKAKGTPTKVFDFLQSIGLTLSYRWTLDAEKRLAATAKADMCLWVEEEAFLIDIDNVLLTFGVSSQRVWNRTETINCTAGTVIKLPRYVLSALQSYTLSVSALRVRMADARKVDRTNMPHIRYRDLLNPAAYSRLKMQYIFEILRVLLDLPGLERYPHRKDARLQPPPPTRQLPTGPEHRAQYFMLETEPIDEVSYEGTQQVIAAFLRQMGLDTPEKQKLYGTKHGIPWGGDGLTTARIRSLQRFRIDADNGWDRLDFLFNFGCLFHTQWWIAIDIHHNHYGTLVGNGFCREIQFLGRTGLAASNKKPDFHGLDELITHFWTASTLDCWLEYADCKDLDTLRAWTLRQPPAALAAMATTIWSERQSTQALVKLDERRHRDPKDFDEVSYYRTMANRDCNFYVTQRRAIRRGDIGVWYDSLSPMLAFFCGGKNTNYLRETVETMQFLMKEAPPEIRDLVLDHCLLVNLSGKPNHFMPTGQLQEYNNDKIKHNFSTHAPGSSLKLTKELSPALPVMDEICKHVDSSFTNLYHGNSHTVPKADFDIARLVERFHDIGTNRFKAGRQVERSADRPKDQFKLGTRELGSGKYFREWWEAREVFNRYASTAQKYDSPPVEGEC
ncbi:hypothetical protein EXIGLDRAFT_834395 [Exidia glandulosa HHB12029]|uniref:DUF6589 domain-containing protein n=1 Tax=Exidia glandulosa HHB12029 TaxID=1314781 RepID=A0A165JRG0_EXIGL|nr:hypothetical protein EXIGLDRAFT_834395 [Exidia glandulosa HHB12029]